MYKATPCNSMQSDDKIRGKAGLMELCVGAKQKRTTAETLYSLNWEKSSLKSVGTSSALLIYFWEGNPH